MAITQSSVELQNYRNWQKEAGCTIKNAFLSIVSSIFFHLFQIYARIILQCQYPFRFTTYCGDQGSILE